MPGVPERSRINSGGAGSECAGGADMSFASDMPTLPTAYRIFS